MKNLSYLVSTLIIVLSANLLQAQSKTYGEFGFHFQQIDGNTGVGLHYTSTPLFQGRLSITFSGHSFGFPVVSDGKMSDEFSHSLTLGLIAMKIPLHDQIHVYAEAGMNVLFVSDKLSESMLGYGGYGLYGFGFGLNESSHIFLEVGLQGSEKRADLIENQPYLANGFLVRTGYRVHINR